MRLYSLRTLWIFLCTIFLSSYISGCSNNNNTPVLAVPEQVPYESEIALAQISQQLYSKKISEKAKINLFFQRGLLYDSLGLYAFAQSDFTQVLSLNDTIPDIYNYLGIYSMREEDYNSAFMAFNTALELNPDYQFAYMNRAIALYRSERYESALGDALKFYNFQPDDPLRVIWVYLVEEKLDASNAKLNLAKRYEALADKTVWGSDIVAFYAGKISEKQLMINLQQGVSANSDLAQRLCETYFYLGKYYLSKGDDKRAEVLFKYALANNVYNYLEHQQALFEIKQLNSKK